MADDHMTYFGERWPSSVCDVLEPGPTPVGEPCLFCGEAIVEGDRGCWVQAVHMGPGGPDPCWHPTHRECQVRELLGGLPHLQKRCSCFGGPGYTEAEKGMTAREEALAVWEFHIRQQNARYN